MVEITFESSSSYFSKDDIIIDSLSSQGTFQKVRGVRVANCLLQLWVADLLTYRTWTAYWGGKTDRFPKSAPLKREGSWPNCNGIPSTDGESRTRYTWKCSFFSGGEGESRREWGSKKATSGRCHLDVLSEVPIGNTGWCFCKKTKRLQWNSQSQT